VHSVSLTRLQIGLQKVTNGLEFVTGEYYINMHHHIIIAVARSSQPWPSPLLRLKEPWPCSVFG